MRFRFALLALTLSLNSVVVAQPLSVDLLTPQEAPDPIPANFRVVDVFFGGGATDIWTAGALRVVTELNATMNFFDSDPVTPGVQPGFVNGGVENQFYTSISAPRGRNAAARFTNAGVSNPGAFDPPGSTPEFSATLLNIAYLDDPPLESPGPGYVARVSVDISGTSLPSAILYGAQGCPPASHPKQLWSFAANRSLNRGAPPARHSTCRCWTASIGPCGLSRNPRHCCCCPHSY